MRRGRLALLAVWAPACALLLLFPLGALDPLAVSGLPDPGALTRWGIPTLQTTRDLAAAATLGLLVLAAWCVPTVEPRTREVAGSQARLLAAAGVTAWVWTLSAMTLVPLLYADASGEQPSTPGFVAQLVFFVTQLDLLIYQLATAALAGLVALGAMVVRRIGGLGVLVLLALAGTWPIALGGHAAGTTSHALAVDLQMVHLVGIGVWLGGVAGLVALRRALETDGHLGVTLRRWSTLAAASVLAIGVSGAAGAWIRLYGWGAMSSAYGALLLLKTGLLGLLVTLGWWQRSRLVPRAVRGESGAFARIVAVELVVLITALGSGIALSRVGPPEAPGGPVEPPPAEALLGAPMPPPLTGGRWLTAWSPDPIWLPVALAMIAAYLLAVRRLRARGDRWPVGRVVLWCAGWVLVVWATSGAPGVYGQVLFSMHMVQHMTVAMGGPVFLALGGPVTLALRALRRREDGTRGPREWLLLGVHSWPATLLATPLVAAFSMVASIVVFYYGGLFEVSLSTHTGHQLMTVHFLLTGYLFANALVGIDPGVKRPSYPMRVLIVMVTFGFHALFAVSLMASTRVLAEDWFASLGRTWGASLADDQYLGASIGWALGEYPLLVVAVALISGWVSSDHRESRRFDRSEQRTGDAELARYNAYLARAAVSGARSRNLTDRTMNAEVTAEIGAEDRG